MSNHDDELPSGSVTLPGGTETRSIRVEADWGTSALWDDAPGGFGPIDLTELPVSPEFASRFDEWTERLEALRSNGDDPMMWEFESLSDAAAFNRDGALLTVELQRELGPGWTVSYAPFPN